MDRHARMNVIPAITIDGPAGSGKSTLGERLARALGWLYFDTGVMYRALTLAAIERAVALDDPVALERLAEALVIDVRPPQAEDGRQYTVCVDGVDVTWSLRRSDVERHISHVAAHPAVRRVMRARQRQIGLRGHVVMVGRDIGSVVMTDAALKIYLVASIDERARRRMQERIARGQPAELAAIRDDIARRDELDRHVMQPAHDAVQLSSEGRSPDELVDQVMHLFSRPTSPAVPS
jgi:cytidylate kinase